MAEIKDLLSAAARKSVTDFATTFEDLMKDKLDAVLADRRAEVLGAVFSKEDVDPEDPVEEVEDDVEDEDDEEDAVWDEVSDEEITEHLEALEAGGELDDFIDALVAEGHVDVDWSELGDLVAGVRSLAELSQKTLGGYVRGAAQKLANNSYRWGKDAAKDGKTGDNVKSHIKLSKGIERATKRLAK